MHHAPLIVERSPFFCCMTTFHFQWDLPLTLPSPRAGANKAGATRGERMKGAGTCTFYATLGSPNRKGAGLGRSTKPVLSPRVSRVRVAAHFPKAQDVAVQKDDL